MRRTIPLLITAACGLVILASQFSPYTEDWGERTSIWFDILASIAMILGGGNLLKVHLKKVSDRAAGWAYSVITLLAFAVTLYVGMVKLGTPPAPEQEKYGQTYATLPIAAFPLTFEQSGFLPPDDLPASVARQLKIENDRFIFRGWMTPNQRGELMAVSDDPNWQCQVEKLYEKAQPPESLAGRASYNPDHQVLAFAGAMTPGDHERLLALSGEKAWVMAVKDLFERTNKVTTIKVESGPKLFTPERAREISARVTYDPNAKTFSIVGPMSVALREELRAQFDYIKPDTTARRSGLLKELDDMAAQTLNEKQIEAVDTVLKSAWTLDQLYLALKVAGQGTEGTKSACQIAQELVDGVQVVDPKLPAGPSVELNDAQKNVIEEFVNSDEKSLNPYSLRQLADAIRKAGTFTGNQEAALNAFFDKVTTVPRQRAELFEAVAANGPFSEEHQEYLLRDYRAQVAWETEVGRLFLAAHQVKYPWSGTYNEQGTAFWWIYEYMFKPLTATMFAMLAFYVASAAFRAFRAKNVEATLLLVTAFIILLGRTYAGTVLTAWIPDQVAGIPVGGLRIENLTVIIMSIFNTAGTRAIMIGIALGIASTSLKVILGIDRSYLGSGGD